ncbi:ATP-dependent RNA helicase [Bifidobacterium tissieri]|uniref:ATP-dependent RNA helicase n=2 Tax=Bifidobacterium tissieri TaxID=1630162 RepID=A0A261FJ25_9BIFI|nr:ATP-dependent RNA helicase [Bifidobacterium tissieri]
MPNTTVVDDAIVSDAVESDSVTDMTDTNDMNESAADAVTADDAADVADDVKPVSFAELGVPKPLVRVLAADGKTEAFPIQADTLPDSLAGRDLLGRGRTGSGKTLAFSIPLVARLAKYAKGRGGNNRRHEKRANGNVPHPLGLVLAPTRELVNQIDEVIQPLAAMMGMNTVTIYGGVKQGRQVDGLNRGAEIVVACPGRLEDLLGQGLLSLESVEITVLDEADEMADMGFLPSVTRLLEKVDPRGQRMLFSATLDHGVDGLVKRFMHNAKVHEVDDADAQVDTMTHHLFVVSQGNKATLVNKLAGGKGKRILFTRTKFQAQKLAAKLVKSGIPAVDLQGNLNQNQRDRHLAAFTNGDVNVLVATDVAARGIDVSDVELVVQVDPPMDPKSFLHRSGRTARAGESGDVVTLVLPSQERGVRATMRRAGIQVKSTWVKPEDPAVKELVGEYAPLVFGWQLKVPAKPKKTTRHQHHGGRRGAAERNDRNERNDVRRGAENRGGGKRGAVARNAEERGRGRRGTEARYADQHATERKAKRHQGKQQNSGMTGAHGTHGSHGGRNGHTTSRAAQGFRKSRRKAAPFRVSRGR